MLSSAVRGLDHLHEGHLLAPKLSTRNSGALIRYKKKQGSLAFTAPAQQEI